MIPKVIHYIWLGGGKKPRNFEKVYGSWQKYAKGFTLKEWSEKGIEEFQLPPYYYKCIREKKWAFASDVLRFYILEKYGGVYLDIDQLLLKDINTPEILEQKSFIARYHEVTDYFGFGFIGSVPHSTLAKKMITFYKEYSSEIDVIVNKPGSIIINSLSDQSADEIHIFDQHYFYPLTDADITKYTYSKHLSNRSWVPLWKKCLYKIPGYLSIKKYSLLLVPKSIKNKLFKISY